MRAALERVPYDLDMPMLGPASKVAGAKSNDNNARPKDAAGASTLEMAAWGLGPLTRPSSGAGQVENHGAGQASHVHEPFRQL